MMSHPVTDLGRCPRGYFKFSTPPPWCSRQWLIQNMDKRGAHITTSNNITTVRDRHTLPDRHHWFTGQALRHNTIPDWLQGARDKRTGMVDYATYDRDVCTHLRL